MEVCFDVIMFNYVNLMVMNIWVMYVCYLYIKQVGLCYLVQGMVEELVCDFNIDLVMLCYCCVGINYMVFYLELECKIVDGSYVNFYLELLAVYEVGQVLKLNIYGNICCQNIVCYEMFKKLGYFVMELLEYFVEYILWFIKLGCEDLIECYKVLLDEYLKCCVEQLVNWYKELEEYKKVFWIDIKLLWEYVSIIMNVIWIGELSVIYGNVCNDGLIDNLL